MTSVNGISSPTIQNVSATNSGIQVRWNDKTQSTFHYVWLRDNDPRNRTPNGQIVHDPFTISLDVVPAAIDVDHSVHILWPGQNERSTYTAEWLRSNSYDACHVTERRMTRKTWNAAEIAGRVPYHDYRRVAKDQPSLRGLLFSVWEHGFAVLSNVPTDDQMVLEVAGLFGHVRETNYGKMFDLVGVPSAEDRGHDNKRLQPHVDNPYRDPAPTVQLLHYLVNDADGGENTLADGFRIAEQLRSDNPEAFALLTTVPVSYLYRDEHVELESEGAIIQLDENGNVSRVQMSPINIQPFYVRPDLMMDFYRAYHAFGKMTSHDDFQIRLKFSAGDLLICDNRRILHGREAFKASGDRHLQGCYADSDALWSKLAVLSRCPGGETTQSRGSDHRPQ